MSARCRELRLDTLYPLVLCVENDFQRTTNGLSWTPQAVGAVGSFLELQARAGHSGVFLGGKILAKLGLIAKTSCPLPVRSFLILAVDIFYSIIAILDASSLFPLKLLQYLHPGDHPAFRLNHYDQEILIQPSRAFQLAPCNMKRTTAPFAMPSFILHRHTLSPSLPPTTHHPPPRS